MMRELERRLNRLEQKRPPEGPRNILLCSPAHNGAPARAAFQGGPIFEQRPGESKADFLERVTAAGDSYQVHLPAKDRE